MNDVLVSEYVDLCEQIAAQALFSEWTEQRLCDRLDRLWHTEMTADDRAEAQARLNAKAQIWKTRRPERDASEVGGE